MNKINDVNTLSVRLLGIGDVLIYLLVSLAVLYIVWNVIHYLIQPGAEVKKESGMNILWGFVGLFIILSIWGIVNILVNTFSTNPNVPKDRFPTVNFVTNTQNQPANQNTNATSNFNSNNTTNYSQSGLTPGSVDKYNNRVVSTPEPGTIDRTGAMTGSGENPAKFNE